MSLLPTARHRPNQFTRLNPVQVVSVEAARLAAYQALQGAPGVSVVPDGDLDPLRLAELRDRTSLRLASVGDGRTFTPVWTLRMQTTDGSVLAAAVDGTSAELLGYWDPNPSSDCEPANGTPEKAIGIPQNDEIPDRELWAIPTNEQPGFTHEGAGAAGSANLIVVHKGENRFDACAAIPGPQWYSVLPIRDHGTEEMSCYDNFASPETVPGRIGGDALWKTYQAIAYFWEQDWFGWSGKGAPARVVVNAQHPQWYKDNAQFFLEDQDFTPAGSVAIYPKALRARSVAASLDVVAHEWGHGVIYSSAGWDYRDVLPLLQR